MKHKTSVFLLFCLCIVFMFSSCNSSATDKANEISSDENLSNEEVIEEVVTSDENLSNEEVIEEVVTSEVWRESKNIRKHKFEYAEKSSENTRLYKFDSNGRFEMYNQSTGTYPTGTWEPISEDYTVLQNHIKALGYNYEITEVYQLKYDNSKQDNRFLKTTDPGYAIHYVSDQDSFNILYLTDTDEYRWAPKYNPKPETDINTTPKYNTKPKCQYEYSNGTICGATCTKHDTLCNKHFNEIADTIEYLDNKLNNSSKNYDYEIDLFYMEVEY